MHITEIANRLGINPTMAREFVAKLATDAELFESVTARVRTHVATGRPCQDDGGATAPPEPAPPTA